MGLLDEVGVHEVVIPAVCFVVCVLFQAWEFAAPYDESRKVRSLFKSVREGWVKQNYMKGTVACNTTRDYIKSALFFASSSITLATFTVGYAGTLYTECKDENDCTAEDWLLVIKLGFLATALLGNFFVFTQCARFAVHFSFCINTKDLEGVPISHSLLVNVFNHTHHFYSLGLRLYFGTIPVFAWIFSHWVLLAVTPVYVFMVHGLENTRFVRDDMVEIASQKSARPLLSAAGALSADTELEGDAAKRV